MTIEYTPAVPQAKADKPLGGEPLFIHHAWLERAIRALENLHRHGFQCAEVTAAIQFLEGARVNLVDPNTLMAFEADLERFQGQ